MTLPDLHLDSTCFGEWQTVSNIEALIPTIADRYGKRYARYFVGDRDDLEQEGRLALWLWLKDQEGVERVRELQALSVIHNAMQAEIANTRRLHIEDAEQDAINWKAICCPNRQLNDDQKYLLFRFQQQASQLARRPNWEYCWLVRGLEWTPLDVTIYQRRKRDDRRVVRPEVVMKRVLKAEKRIRDGLPQSLITELNQISWC